MMSWSRAFDDPITLRDGRVLKTLRDVGHYVAGLPKAKHDQPQWRLAATMLMQAADEGAPTMLARIAMLRALNADGEPVRPEPRRKRVKKYRVVRSQ